MRPLELFLCTSRLGLGRLQADQSQSRERQDGVDDGGDILSFDSRSAVRYYWRVYRKPNIREDLDVYIRYVLGINFRLLYSTE